jgi:hypothetical protein
MPMSRIVAGRFDRTLDADAVLEALKREGFSRSEVDAFYVSPPGQHAMTAAGGDAPHRSEGSQRGGVGAAIGAVLGLVVGLIAGFVGAIDLGRPTVPLAALLGALVGAFAGALASFRGGERRWASVEHPVEPRAGRMVAVCVDRAGSERAALDILRAHNARDVGRAEGQWRDGWRDFDPRNPLAAV